MSERDDRPFVAEDLAPFDLLFRHAAFELRDTQGDVDDLMDAVVSRLVAEIDRLREAGNGWAGRWSAPEAELTLLRLAEQWRQACRRVVH